MRDKSVYCVECLCGQHIESETSILSCPGCGREVLIVWPAEAEDADRVELNRLLTAA